MQLGVVADDVTGATDLASVLRRERWSVVQTFGVPESPPSSADAVVVSLKTRTAPVDVATAAARAAARYLRGAGAAQIYFKYCSTFDSTNEGNIGPVIEALLDETGDPFTIACPAYPTLGRTLYLGHLFVGEQLLSESPMCNHPLTPMTDANLVRVLARQSTIRVGLVALGDVENGEVAIGARFAALMAEGCKAAIADAVFDRHLDAIARACRDFRLVTGGAGLAGALARAAKASAHASPAAPPGRSGSIAVLSGSGSAATLAQVRQLSARVPHRAIDPLTLADNPGVLADVVDWACRQSREGHLLVYSTTTADAMQNAQRVLGRAEAAALLERAFGTIASALAAQGVRAFVIAGGETSGAVLEAIGVKMLGFGEEIEPGVPWTYSLEPAGFHLALKSGNFGSPDFFARALEIIT